MTDKKQAPVALSDEELEHVTGGTNTGYEYWFAGTQTDPEKCTDGGPHKWLTSPGGNFDYCCKCNSERYKR